MLTSMIGDFFGTEHSYRDFSLIHSRINESESPREYPRNNMDIIVLNRQPKDFL